MKTSRSVAGALLAALLAAAVPGAAAEHKVLIPASKLLPWEKAQADRRLLMFVQGTPAGAAFFYAPLRLPAGATISGLSYRHYGGDATAHTVVGIDRVRAGETPSWQRLYQGSSTAFGVPGPPVTVTGSAVPGAARKVKKGWAYFVMLAVDNQASTVIDVTVKYRDP